MKLALFCGKVDTSLGFSFSTVKSDPSANPEKKSTEGVIVFVPFLYPQVHI